VRDGDVDQLKSIGIDRTGRNMKILNAISTISLLTAAALAAHAAAMLSVTNMNALEGLAPITALGNTDAGKAALASNFTITGDIQSGAAKQPSLLSFPGQQQQALRDAFITGVAYELADEPTAVLEKACGGKIADCAVQDQSRFADLAMDKVFYEATQTYGLPVVFANNAQGTEDVAKLAPEAGYLLTAAFPSLTLAQADAILTLTEGRGGFLDNGSAFGVYSRLDLYRAAEQAVALSANGK
jgi:hypothetical protein